MIHKRITGILIALFAFFIECTASNVVIPYKNAGGKLMVKVTLGGKERNFVFDTGAPLYITSSLAAEIKAEGRGQQGIIDASNKNMKLGKVSVKDLKLGDNLILGDATAIVIPEGNMIEKLGIDGMIGCDVFPNKVLRIDSRKELITIANESAQFNISPRCMIPLSTNEQNIPLVNLNYGGDSELTMFDSGSADFLELSNSLSSQLIDDGCITVMAEGYGSQGIGMGGQGNNENMKRVKMSDFRIATGKFQNVVAKMANVPLTRLGSSLLKYGVVTIDFPKGAFYFEPFETTPVDMYVKSWNIDITVNNGYVCVSCIWDKSLLDRIDVGDRIVSVDGKPVEPIDVSKALKGSLLDVKGDRAELEILNKHGEKVKIGLERK